MLHHVFHKTEEEKILSNLFYEGSTIVIPKLDKDSTRKLQTDIFHKHRFKKKKTLQWNIS